MLGNIQFSSNYAIISDNIDPKVILYGSVYDVCNHPHAISWATLNIIRLQIFFQTIPVAAK